MSEQESNICVICGGVKRIEYVIGFEEGRPRDMRLNAPESLPETGWRLCPGHPEPATGTVSPWLREQVLLAIGRASMDTRDGMFDHAQAKEIAEQLIQAIVSERGQRIPEPAQKHDGSLGQGDSVSYDRYHRRPVHVKLFVGADDIVMVPDMGEIAISPQKALSLLAWLRQEESELERFAKEQTRE